MRLVSLAILSRGRRLPFLAELPVTRRERGTGWMHRVLPPGPGRGMLFLVEPPQPFSLWMANTLVPLDMLFAGPDGRIVMIATGQPLDRTPVMCPVPVRAALEIAGGAASALGIRSGDVLLGLPVWR